MTDHPFTVRIIVDDQQPHRGRSQDLATTLEFPFRPTEAELKLALAKFFSKLNFRFDENLDEVRECSLVLPLKEPRESSPDRR